MIKPIKVAKSEVSPVMVAHSNGKGGVSKTTTTFHMSYRLAEQGHKVLVVDVDGQLNMSTLMLGYEEVEHIQKSGFTSDQLFNETPEIIDDMYVYESKIHKNIHVIPGNSEKIASVLNAGKTAVIAAPKAILSQLDYDYVLIDTPPSLGITQLAAIYAVDRLFIPVVIDDFSNSGLVALFKTMGKVRERMDAKVDLGGIYITMFNKQHGKKTDDNYAKALKSIEEKYKGYLISTYIPHSKVITESRMAGLAPWVKAPNGNAAVVGRTVRTAIDEMISTLPKRGEK